MRTETITYYTFDELSADAKEKAIDNYRETNTEVFWIDEIVDSYNALLSLLNLQRDYRYGRVKGLSEDISNLHGARALGWLENNLFWRLRITRANYLKHRKDYLKYGNQYRIGCIKPCALTGYCADETFLKSLTDCVMSGMCLGDAFSNLEREFDKMCEAEQDHQNSAEFISEHLTINEYEFTADGKMI